MEGSDWVICFLSYNFLQSLGLSAFAFPFKNLGDTGTELAEIDQLRILERKQSSLSMVLTGNVRTNSFSPLNANPTLRKYF